MVYSAVAARYFQAMRILIAVLLAWSGAGFALAAAADEVYRWVDSDGVVHYSDKPLAPTDKPVALPHLQTYKPGASPGGAAGAADQPGAGAPGPSEISISSPAQDETIRDAEGKFTVTVAANPQPGQGLIYYLDGSAQNHQPTPSTAFLYSGVDRGEHRVAAALVNGNGEEIARTAEVTINMKPPAARH